MEKIWYKTKYYFIFQEQDLRIFTSIVGNDYVDGHHFPRDLRQRNPATLFQPQRYARKSITIHLELVSLNKKFIHD